MTLPFPTVEYATEKYPDQPHYRGTLHRLGADEHGTWLWGGPGRPIYRGDVELFVANAPVLALIPTAAWWAVSWFVDHPEIEIYVNINTPARDEGYRIVAVDVDLDVVRYLDGRVEVIDRDEFEEHQVRYDYPPELVEAAEAATAEAFDLVVANGPPFDGTAARDWIALAARSANV